MRTAAVTFFTNTNRYMVGDEVPADVVKQLGADHAFLAPALKPAKRSPVKKTAAKK